MMNKLRSYGYNTMLACRETATESFKASTNVVWNWENGFLLRRPPIRLSTPRIVSTFSAPRTPNPVIGVFWDMVKCPCPIPIPNTMNIESALSSSSKVVNGKGGSVEYCCFGDNIELDKLDPNFRANLTSAGFDLIDISDGSKDAKMKPFVNILMWCFHHPRSSILLITNDDIYVNCITRLDKLRFQFMFAYVDPTDQPTRKLIKVSTV
ncbi:hypothetical protein TSUD_239370 [Trifolium subterraneum]|uniref:NYN domain-containing protein n=1 Tax=Trifolium subterraneum TaxID=3900 RepID=A0A2Z6NDT4_TRISU|nr:hypothetical protein TSUD_239370 [Trifolium subterraneum]